MREGKRNQPSNFNQWQSIDLTMSQTIQQKINLLEYLELQCSEVSGITKQREGQVGPNELVGNTQQAVVQSSAITEEWFYQHNSLKGRVLESLIDNYIFQNLSRFFVVIKNNANTCNKKNKWQQPKN